jgi:hypothetical protein
LAWIFLSRDFPEDDTIAVLAADFLVVARDSEEQVQLYFVKSP